jgi:hypothetical protein
VCAPLNTNMNLIFPKKRGVRAISRHSRKMLRLALLDLDGTAWVTRAGRHLYLLDIRQPEVAQLYAKLTPSDVLPVVEIFVSPMTRLPSELKVKHRPRKKQEQTPGSGEGLEENVQTTIP